MVYALPPLDSRHRVCDLACGTGNVITNILQAYPEVESVTLIDRSRDCLNRCADKIRTIDSNMDPRLLLAEIDLGYVDGMVMENEVQEEEDEKEDIYRLPKSPEMMDKRQRALHSPLHRSDKVRFGWQGKDTPKANLTETADVLQRTVENNQQHLQAKMMRKRNAHMKSAGFISGTAGPNNNTSLNTSSTAPPGSFRNGRFCDSDSANNSNNNSFDSEDHHSTISGASNEHSSVEELMNVSRRSSDGNRMVKAIPFDNEVLPGTGENGYDVIVSGLGFHSIVGHDLNHDHQAQNAYSPVAFNRYRVLAQRAYNSLSSGGHVVIGDHVGALPCYEQMRLLDECGFVDIDVAWRKQDFFVIGAHRP
eukprot:Nk52_evm67s1737 gene=Nk52_evmTU67s1737